MYDGGGSSSLVVGGEREAAKARERTSKQCLLSVSRFLQEKIKERTHTYTHRGKRASKKKGENKREREGERDATKKQKGFFRLLINRNHKKAQHTTRVYSSLSFHRLNETPKTMYDIRYDKTQIL
jgi:DNA invertase Pin-like site-specific DNA recombinase